MIKLLNKSRFFISFFLVLFFSFTFIFHNFGETITSNNNLVSQEDFSINSQEQQRLFLEKKKNYLLTLRFGLDRTIGRDLVKQSRGHENRHYTRWVVAQLDGKIIETFQKYLSPKTSFILYSFYLALLFSLSFLLCFLSIEIITKQKNFKSSLLCAAVFLFYLYPLYFQVHDEFTIREVLAISGCIYFSLKRNLGLYLVFAIYGVLNRETGLLLMLIYPLINYKKNLYFIPILILPSVFILFNYDLFFQKEFYKAHSWFATATIKEYTFLGFYGVQYFYSVLRIIIYILPTILLLFFIKPERNCNILIFIFFIYFIALLFGTPLANNYPYMILLPMMLLINSYAFRNIKGN